MLYQIDNQLFKLINLQTIDCQLIASKKHFFQFAFDKE
jgi:hypothetical protein